MPNSVVQGSLKLIGLVDGMQWESLEAFLKAFPQIYGVEVPDTITNVIVSNVQPLDSDRTKIWFQVSNAGSFVGIFMYASGAWQQIYPVPQQVFRVVGNSATPPAGFALADASIPWISAGVAAALLATWHSNGLGGYDIFDVVYVGF